MVDERVDSILEMIESELEDFGALDYVDALGLIVDNLRIKKKAAEATY